MGESKIFSVIVAVVVAIRLVYSRPHCVPRDASTTLFFARRTAKIGELASAATVRPAFRRNARKMGPMRGNEYSLSSILPGNRRWSFCWREPRSFG